MNAERKLKTAEEVLAIVGRRPLFPSGQVVDPYDLGMREWHDVHGLLLYRNQVGSFWADEDEEGLILWHHAQLGDDLARLGRFLSRTAAVEHMEWLAFHRFCLKCARANTTGDVPLTREQLSQMEADHWNETHEVGALVGYPAFPDRPLAIDRTTSPARADPYRREAVVSCGEDPNVPVSMCEPMIELGHEGENLQLRGVGSVKLTSHPCAHCGGTERFHQTHCLCAVLGYAPCGGQLEVEIAYRRGFSQALHTAFVELSRRHGGSLLTEDLKRLSDTAYSARMQPAPDWGYDAHICRLALADSKDEVTNLGDPT